MVGVAASGAVKSLVKALGVLLPFRSTDLLLAPQTDGSSMSFSTRGVRPVRVEDEPSLWYCTVLLELFAGGPVKADNGREELTGEGALIEAWAVLADTEEVGGPEEKMDRLGVLKSEDWCAGA